MPRSDGIARRAREASVKQLVSKRAGARHAPREAREKRFERGINVREASAMRNLGRGVIAGVVFVAACGGGTKNADTTSAAAGGPAAGQPAAAAGSSPSAGGAAAGGAAAGGAAAAAQAPTGKTWEVKMGGD